MKEAGYTELVVFLAQQVQQFRLQGGAFAMQHLGSEEEIQKMWADIVQKMTPEDLKLLPWTRIMPTVPLEDRLSGLTPEERLKGLPPEDLVKLRKLLQEQTGKDDSTRSG